MKNYLLLILAFVANGLFANNYTDYKNHTANDRFLLVFNEGVTEADKNRELELSGMVNSYTHLPAPAVTICMINANNYEQALAYFRANSHVKFVSFFITDGKHHAGVLNQFFVKITDGNFEPILKQKLEKNGLTKFQKDKYIPNLYLVQVTDLKNLNTIEWCSEFLKESWCQYAAPNYLVNPLVCSSDPLYNRQWNIQNTGNVLQGSGTVDADMDVDSAWTITTGNPAIKVGILDSGVDTLHEDLAANMLPGHDAVNDSTDGYPTPAYPNDGHGTCCAGIVAAVKDNNKGIAGVAPSCKIIPVRAFYYVLLPGASDPLPYSTAAAFADAIGWSWNVAGADVLSNSWGLPPALITFLPGGMQPVNDAIQLAFTSGRNGKGVPMFFSSGNENDSIGPIWPSSLAQTIAVGATSMCDERKSPDDCSGEAWGADHGTGLDFSAPGVKISSTDISGNKGYTNSNYSFTFNGTSAACPNAAGVGALLLSVRADLLADDVRNIIAQSAERVGGYNYTASTANGSWCKELGHGRVNAYRALQHSVVYSSVDALQQTLAVRVFPNPSQGMFQVQCNEAKSTWKLYTITGAETLTGTLEKGMNTIDAESLTTGLYVLAVKTTGGVATVKITITR